MKHLLTSLLFLTLLSTNAFAQVIKGTISYDNEPLAGVTIILQGTQEGTITDIDGKYEINVSEGQDTLVFSYIGCETLYKSFNLKKGETIVFDTTLTKGRYCLEVEAIKTMDIFHYDYMRYRNEDGIVLFTNNYIKYGKNDYNEEIAVGVHFQPEIAKSIRIVEFGAMCDMLYL